MAASGLDSLVVVVLLDDTVYQDAVSIWYLTRVA
jgi:hypothetical protein